MLVQFLAATKRKITNLSGCRKYGQGWFQPYHAKILRKRRI